MTANDETLAASDRFPVVSSVLRTYRNVLSKPRRLITITALPAAACLALSAAYLAAPWREHPLGVLYFSLLLVPMSYLGLAWTRNSLWDGKPRFLLVRPWIPANAKVLACYFFWASCLYLWPAAPITVFILLSYGLAGRSDALSTVLPFVPLSWLCLVIVGIVLFARFFLALPLIAAARPASPLAAWRAGADTGLRLGGAVALLAVTFFLISILCLIVLSEAVLVLLGRMDMDLALHDTNFLRYYIQLYLAVGIMVPLGGVLGTVFFAELLAITYRRITVWQSARHDILNRFD